MHFRNYYSKENLVGLIICLFLNNSCFAQTNSVVVKINGVIQPISNSYEITAGENIEFSHTKNVFWFSYKPVLREYNNLLNWGGGPENIQYERNILKDSSTRSFFLDSLPPGTHYIGFSIYKKCDSIATFSPLHQISPLIIQLVVKRDNSYIGILTELLGVPFILPPIKYSANAHQTDYRVGTDCAEFAIYGVRRLGYAVPYIGPKRIHNYLKKTNLLLCGTILHFGFQVSVLYSDKGTLGVLDEEDLLIHAFEDAVKIQSLGETTLNKRYCQLYEWDWCNLPKNKLKP